VNPGLVQPVRAERAKASWHELWLQTSDAYERAVDTLVASECAVRHELVFCLLGGHGVSFELARSATDKVMSMGPFASEWAPTELRSAIRRELSAAQFDPRRKDGTLRRYRFPNRKADLLVRAREWVRAAGSVSEYLATLSTDRVQREWLCSCPGFGPKSASWLLRNTGYASRLAILDVHILRAMEDAGRLPAASLPRDYELVEECFVAWCDELGASVSALDLFLWEWQRGDLGPWPVVGLPAGDPSINQR